MNHEVFDRIGEFKLYRGLRDYYTKAENPQMVCEPGRHAVVQVGDLHLALSRHVIHPFHTDTLDLCLIRADTECGNGSHWRNDAIAHFLANRVIVECTDQDYHETLAYKTARLQLLRLLRAKELEHTNLESVIAREREQIARFL